MSVSWQHSRPADPISSPGSGTSNAAYGGWFAKQSIPQHMYNKYGSLNSRQLSPVNTGRKYHTPTDNDISLISTYRSGHVGSASHFDPHVPYPSADRTDDALAPFGNRGAYRPAISLATTNNTPPNLSAEKTLILISPEATASNTSGGMTSPSRRDSYMYQSPIVRQATTIKTSEDNARLAMNRLTLQRSSTHLGINNMSTAKYNQRFSEEGNNKTVPTITDSSLARSNSFMRNQLPRSVLGQDSTSADSLSNAGNKNHLTWLYGPRGSSTTDDKTSSPTGTSNVSPPTQPHTIYRHGSIVTPTISTVRSDTVKVESDPISRYNSAGLKRRDPLEQSTNATTQPSSDYSMQTSAPRPNDHIIQPPSPRSRVTSPPKSILKKTKRGDSSLGLSGTMRMTSAQYLVNQQNTSLSHYPWSAPSGDQLLSVPNSHSPQTQKKPTSPSKRVSFNF